MSPLTKNGVSNFFLVPCNHFRRGISVNDQCLNLKKLSDVVSEKIEIFIVDHLIVILGKVPAVDVVLVTVIVFVGVVVR